MFSCLFLVGHGQSEGQRAQVHDFDDYVDDTLRHVDLMREKYPNIPAFLLGHSMVKICQIPIL